MDVDHVLMLCLSTECYVKRAHPQNVDVVGIRKMYSVWRQTCLSRIAVCMQLTVMKNFYWIVPILVLYHVNFSTAAVMTPSLDAVCTVHGQPEFTGGIVVTLLSHGDGAPTVRHTGVWMTSTRIT